MTNIAKYLKFRLPRLTADTLDTVCPYESSGTRSVAVDTHVFASLHNMYIHCVCVCVCARAHTCTCAHTCMSSKPMVPSFAVRTFSIRPCYIIVVKSSPTVAKKFLPKVNFSSWPASWVLSLSTDENQFNDTLTHQFRQLAGSSTLSFAYVDSITQRPFVDSLDLTACKDRLDTTDCRKASTSV